MKNIILILLLGAICFSCESFLDEAPDNRAELDSKEKVRKLLVSAYPVADYVTLTELSSDNIIDYKKKNPNYTRFLEEVAYWKDGTATNNSSPKQVWGACYGAIATANEALLGIKKLGENDLLAEKGEALVTRAYNHFLLVNIFSKHYNAKTSKTDLGIPFMSKPETTLDPKYSRGNVADVYKKIENDLETGISLLNNEIYKVKKYHFTKEAAWAFAARFYLYYEKWEKAKKYADLLLGDNPESKLRNWKQLGLLPVDQSPRTNAYIKGSANLLNTTSTSDVGALFGPYYSGSRFNHTSYIAQRETIYAPMPWSGKNVRSDDLNYQMYSLAASNFNKTIFLKIPRLFKITDPVAGIGYTKTVIVPFTTDESLLVRAEAKALLGDLAGALSDVNIWTKNFYRNKETTLDKVNEFYNKIEYSTKENISLKKKLNPSFQITSKDQENMLHYILQCRRVLTLHEGLRWFDVKRYGIVVNRRQYQSDTEKSIIVKETLSINDKRRAIQLPAEIISSGMEKNPR